MGVGRRKSNGVPSTSAIAGRDQRRVDRQEAAGLQRQLLIERAAAAGEVVVAVVRQVDDRRPARRRAVVDAPFVRRGERVAHGHVEPAGVVLVAVVARQRELERDAAVGLCRQTLDRPPALAEAARPAVQCVDAVVQRQLMRLSFEHEAAGGDAVAVASDERAEVRVALDIVREVVEAEHDVRAAAGAVRAVQGGDDAAEVDRAQHQAATVVERVLVHRTAVRQMAEEARRAVGHRLRPSRRRR